ncbi:uncharacterized protein V1518DRAFT_438607 [Limtongia smithiae]|uniref:uncharacterized protein n=1 Tax=Limtongia smithiae TaxID=1125753 RepID=UPI0034CEB24D
MLTYNRPVLLNKIVSCPTPDRVKITSGAKAKNSALTEFLRERGIDANAIRQRYEQNIEQNSATTTEDVTEDTVVTISGSAATAAERRRNRAAEAAAASRARRKSKKKKRDDDSDEDFEDVIAHITRPQPGQIEFCAECSNRFTVTAYSRAAPDGEGLLCHSCGSKYAKEEKIQKKTQISSRKKKKSIAAALLDKQTAAVPKLQDMCIKIIAKYIDDVEMLGDIGDLNMEKIARILSRNRSLKDNTMKLFLGPTIKRLQFWDCSNLSSSSFELIASYCPKIESLTLSMCGQMADEVMDYYGSHFTQLRSLTINGGFLITADCWARFFKAKGSQLVKVSISNTLRFNTKSIESLAEHCGSSLEELTFSRVGSLTTEDLEKYLHKFPKLTSLELSYMRAVVKDGGFIVDVLKLIGPQLLTLNLDDGGDLSDAVLTSGIRPHCSTLQNLSLSLCESFTDAGFRELFADWSQNQGLINANFSRCTNVGDDGMQAFLEHSCKTVVVLNLNSMYLLTAATLQLMAASDCEFLSQLDLGFLRCVTDAEVELLMNKCKSLQFMEVYGNMRVTELAKIRQGVTVVGRPSDSL